MTQANVSHAGENPMGYQPILPLIIKMAVPSMLSMLVQALYNVVDSIFVSHYSGQAFAAVSLVFPIQSLIIGIAVGTGVGLNSLIARRLGADDQHSADSAASHGIFIGIASGLVVALLSLLIPFYINMYSSDPVLTAAAKDYITVIMYCSAFMFVSMNIERILQASGNVIDPMKIMLIGTVTNIILDPIFIFGLCGVPEMGAKGAAIATVLGQFASMALALYIATTPKRKHRVKILTKGFKLNSRVIKDIYRVGIPSIVMQCLAGVMISGLNLILIKFSETAVSVLGIYFKLQSFVFMPIFGLSNGVMPILGYSFGSHNRKRLTTALKYACVIAASIMFLGTLIFFMFTPQLMGLFDPSEEMLSMGIYALRVMSLCFTIAGPCIIMSCFFQACGYGFLSLAMSLLRQIVVLLPVAYAMSFISLDYVWFALPISEFAALAVAVIFLIIMFKKVVSKL